MKHHISAPPRKAKDMSNNYVVCRLCVAHTKLGITVDTSRRYQTERGKDSSLSELNVCKARWHEIIKYT